MAWHRGASSAACTILRKKIMWRFSSLATRVSSFSAIGSSVNLPAFRCDTRVASSWNDTSAHTLSSGLSPES